MDYDVRDRSRFLHALLRGVRSEQQEGTDGGEEEADTGGVILRREQVGVVLLGKRQVREDQMAGKLIRVRPNLTAHDRPIGIPSRNHVSYYG